MQTSKSTWKLVNNATGLFYTPLRNFRRTAQPGFYNLRFKPSQGLDNVYVQYTSNIHGAHWQEQHKTERNPDKFPYSNLIFKNDFQEWRLRAADYLYQIFQRLHRSNDGWTRSLIGYTAFCFLMFNQALIWKIHLCFFTMVTLARIRDKGAEPTIDEVWVLDTIFKNEKLNQLFTPETYHVVDYDQEFDHGRENPYFPEYRTPMAKFFNADANTTTGRYKFGDVESGAMMTLHFKTMPFANNKYNFSEPFMVYDMYAEVTHNGKFFVEHIIKAEEILKTKRIFEQLCSQIIIKKDYYEILSLSKQATEEEIKKAYRKLALKLHPDKNRAPKATDAFKKLSQAFACLSDPEKRRNYDQFGSEEEYRQKFQSQASFFRDDFNPNDIFRMFFQDAGSMDDLFGGSVFGRPYQRTTRRRQTAEDIGMNFFEAFTGGGSFQKVFRGPGGTTFVYQSSGGANRRQQEHHHSEEEDEHARLELLVEHKVYQTTSNECETAKKQKNRFTNLAASQSSYERRKQYQEQAEKVSFESCDRIREFDKKNSYSCEICQKNISLEKEKLLQEHFSMYKFCRNNFFYEQLEIDKSAINSQFIDKAIEKFNFDILLRDKFPFQPPLIMTRTKVYQSFKNINFQFCTPSLADGRDLLLHIIPKDCDDWRPSMNLYELIQYIPDFISESLLKASKEEERLGQAPEMIGKFHLGLQYDINIWLSNQQCGVFPCQEEKGIQQQLNTSMEKGQKKRGMIDIYVVVTESVFLMLEPDHKIKNVARLVAWATLPALEQIKRNLDNPDSITFIWRRVDEKDPWILNVIMQNANECLNLIVKHMKRSGLIVNKNYEKKRKILESEVSKGAIKELKIDDLLQTISQYETVLNSEPNQQTIQHLIMLYNKAIEYYSALNDEKHLEYLQKLQKLFQDDQIQKLMDVSDRGASTNLQSEESKVEITDNNSLENGSIVQQEIIQETQIEIDIKNEESPKEIENTQKDEENIQSVKEEESQQESKEDQEVKTEQEQKQDNQDAKEDQQKESEE